MQNSSLWQEVLAAIETEVSKAIFITLFKGTSLVSLEDSSAVVSSRSSITASLLKKRFSSLIEKTLKEKTGKEINVRFIVSPQKEVFQEESTPLFSQTEEVKTNTVLRSLSRVRGDYTFSNMAVSGSNQLAFVSAQAVSKNLGKFYNPLFIYGPVGVGKTHLMQAVANDVFSKFPDKKIIYITSEEFTNEVVDSIRTNQTSRMKKRFRNCELLLIDDVQFIAGKEKVQEELFHTFNILVDNHSQIVLSSDRPPQEIKKLEKRLSSRFAGGLTVDIGTPDLELRTAIVLIKARKYSVSLTSEAAETIAQETEDTRGLEGLLQRVVMQLPKNPGEIDKERVLSLLGTTRKTEKRISSEDVINAVCDYYSLKPSQLRGPRRTTYLVRARQVAMYILKKDLSLSLEEIGLLLGGRDHTTVMHGISKIEKVIQISPELPGEIQGISKHFK